VDYFWNGSVYILSRRWNSFHIGSAKCKSGGIHLPTRHTSSLLSQLDLCFIFYHLLVIKPTNYSLKFLCKHSFSPLYKINHVFWTLSRSIIVSFVKFPVSYAPMWVNKRIDAAPAQIFDIVLTIVFKIFFFYFLKFITLILSKRTKTLKKKLKLFF
jgi:hypothetical protein